MERTNRLSLSALLAISVVAFIPGCTAREDEPGPRSYGQIEKERADILPVSHRARLAMGAETETDPQGLVSTVISLDKQVYHPDDPVYLTILWVNNSPRPVRVCRRIFLLANFDALVLLNDEIRVIPGKTPPPPETMLREQDFVVIEPYGEASTVVNLEDFPASGVAAGWNETWGYALDRRGHYKARVSLASVPRALVPDRLLGDPEVVQWEGSTLSNIVEFQVRR